MSTRKKIILFLSIIILIIVFTPIFGNLYKYYFGPVSSGFFLGPSHPERVSGFFMSYVFFITLLLTIFGGKKKYRLIAILLLVALILLLGSWEDFIINIVLIIVGWLLGWAIKMIYQKAIAKKN